MELIRSLRGRYYLYVLSNNNPISRAYFCEMLKERGLDPEEVFKQQFYSYEMHMLKPAREMFECVRGRIGAKPEEILFIDDAAENVEAAAAAGITTLWLRPGMDIAEEVEKVLAEAR